MTDVAQLLAKTKLFGLLGEQDRDRIAQQMRPVSFTAGQAIFARGDPGTEVYLVLKGRVRLSVLSLEGRELSFTHAGPGDVFGEIATLDGGARTADATAVTAVEAMTLSRAALNRFLEISPELARAAILLLCGRIRDADLQLEGVALHRIEVRLARYFLSLVSQQHGQPTAGSKPKVVLGMSQGELALLLGASRPKVNAALMLLEDSGAITREGDRFICDCDELNQVAEFG
ncbi:MAG TPA: Crp/Fnr family transcriptional regulator [Hyphomicrobiaceae bacterium]|nr:Crp/Fnr family transcriptional regulator [Hyphomicrobiaceae bacterium]